MRDHETWFVSIIVYNSNPSENLIKNKFCCSFNENLHLLYIPTLLSNVNIIKERSTYDITAINILIILL